MITSLSNSTVKHLVRLREEKRYREEQGSVLIVGKTVTKELALSGKAITIIIEAGFPPPPVLNPKQVIELSPQVFKKVTGMTECEPIAIEAKIPQESDVSLASYLLVLDTISDPGNLGTLLRTALALNWDGVFLTPQCVDIWNDKAIRSARGASFFIPFQKGSYELLDQIIQKRKGTCLIASSQGKTVAKSKIDHPVTLILGNETHGPCKELMQKGEWVGIPINPRVESLNVAIAGAILMEQIYNTNPNK